MHKFVQGLERESNKTLTENGAVAFSSTGNKLLDLFGTIGALRSRPAASINGKFMEAFLEDKLLAMKMLFYARNIRGGLGERETAKVIYSFMADNYPEIMKKNLALVPFFGRWDDMYVFVGTKLEKEAFDLMKEQFLADLTALQKNEKTISLLGKWLKSAEHVSYASCRLGKITAKHFGLSLKQYRKSLSLLRDRLNVLERNMSRQEWERIQYEEIPALAMKKYHNALQAHSIKKFTEYIEKVKAGTAKINAATLYPYNILEDCQLDEDWHSETFFLRNWNEVAEAQWKALPNYVEGENNILVMADTSGSMSGRPLLTSIGLAMYFAERNKGAFKDTFLTFSRIPSLVKLKGENLREKVRCIKDICENTNIEAAFDLVLRTAIENDLKQDEIPKAIIIISDMEFDSATGKRSGWYGRPIIKEEEYTNHSTLMSEISAKYLSHGYKLPKIVYWNVDARNNTYHAVSEWKNVALVSGQSTSTFKTVLRSIDEDPIQTMLNTLNDPMYDVVQI